MQPVARTEQRRRRTQAERSAATQASLVEATIACLVERGFAGTTTLAVCRRAGVSHGSLLHHYGRRERLLGAALAAIYARLRERVVTGLEALPEGDDRIEGMVDLMWSACGAPEFKAVVELWLAAANDPALSFSVWPEARAFDAGNAELAAQLFPEAAERVNELPVYVSLLFQAMQGMGLAAATLPASAEGDSMRERVRGLLRRILRDALGARPDGRS